MSAMDAFHSTWSQANDTFGSGAPTDGSQYDKSTQLRQLQSNVTAAKPDDRWQGAAADAYAAKNDKHAASYGKIADLDPRMAAEIKNAADVVTNGRKSLEELRGWASDAAASTPNNRSGDLMKLSIASKGIGQISEIVQKSNHQMVEISERLRGIGKEYAEIGEDKDNINNLGNWKENPPPVTPDDNRTQEDKIEEWNTKWGNLAREIENLWKTRPPDGTPEGPAVAAWRNRRKELLNKEVELAQEGAELGIEIAGTPPPSVQTTPTPHQNMRSSGMAPTEGYPVSRPGDTPRSGVRAR